MTVSKLAKKKKCILHLFTVCVMVVRPILKILILFCKWKLIRAAACHSHITSAPSEDSDQPGHLPSLIRVFAVCMKKAWVLSYSLSAQRRLSSDSAYAQADLSPCWVQRSFCWVQWNCWMTKKYCNDPKFSNSLHWTTVQTKIRLLIYLPFCLHLLGTLVLIWYNCFVQLFGINTGAFCDVRFFFQIFT